MTRRVAVALTRRTGTVVAAMLLACAGGGTLASPSTQDPGGASGQNGNAICMPAGSAPNGPVGDSNGPYYHQVVIARTVDGLTMTGAHQVLDHASVPDGVRRADGSVWVYYVNGAAGSVYAARIEGDSARVLGPISINGVNAPAGAVDPDVVLLPGGVVRMTYLNGFGPPNSTVLRAMCMADSNDGLHFTTRSAAFTWSNGEQYTDPSIVQLPDATWLMAISLGQQTVIARSTDGLVFTKEATLSFGGVPELARAPDGATRLYVCGAGIVAYRSTDHGRSWLRERTVMGPGFEGRRIVCDPSLVAGADMFVFKTGL